jgi:hypothetical protein
MIASALLLLFQQTLVLAGEETFRWAHFIGPILFFL